ncbi:MAG: hypothetical protein R2853_00850 [Thermomicrobiales bacterium]
MKVIQDFGRFWYDFIVGDDPVVAIGVVAAMAVTALLAANGVNAWWLMLIGVFAPLAYSLSRAAH